MVLDENNGPALVATIWPITIASGTVLGLRIFAKISRGRYIWWDDIIMLFSQTLLLIAVSLITRAEVLGFGKNWALLDPDARWAIATYGTFYSASAPIIVASARVSFAVAMLRVTPSVGWGRVLVRTIIVGLIFITALPIPVSRLTLCKPVQAVWGHIPGECGNTYIPLYLGWASGAWSAFSDFALTLLAWKIIWSMRMRTKEKIGVAIALSFGLLSGAITIFRYTFVALIYNRDFYQYGYFGFICMAAEGATSIIAASIPALRAFFVERARSPEGRRRWLAAPLVFGAPFSRASWRRRSHGAAATIKTPSKSSDAPDSTVSDFRQHYGGYGNSKRSSENVSSVRCDDWDDADSGRELRPLSPRPVYRQALSNGDIEWMAGRA